VSDGRSSQARWRGVAVLLLKLTFTAGLLYWLIHAGALRWSDVTILLRDPVICVADIAVWLATSVVIMAVRWRILLGLLDVTVPWPRAFALQMVALFFNTALPGNIGGDVAKGLFVARDHAPDKAPSLVLVAFGEKVFGVLGLIAMSALVVAIRFGSVWPVPVLRPLVGIVTVMGVMAVLGTTAVLVAARSFKDVAFPDNARGRAFRHLRDMALLALRAPRQAALALALSIANHAIGLGFFTMVTKAVLGRAVSFANVATVYPLGVLTVTLPISFAGIGVGHKSFDALFSVIGLSDGANVFNVFLVGQAAPCLLGAIPYVLMRRRT
jgi:uncharacterized membrane protein YbhN (UPF0104 family)